MTRKEKVDFFLKKKKKLQPNLYYYTQDSKGITIQKNGLELIKKKVFSCLAEYSVHFVDFFEHDDGGGRPVPPPPLIRDISLIK